MAILVEIFLSLSFRDPILIHGSYFFDMVSLYTLHYIIVVIIDREWIMMPF